MLSKISVSVAVGSDSRRMFAMFDTQVNSPLRSVSVAAVVVAVVGVVLLMCVSNHRLRVVSRGLCKLFCDTGSCCDAVPDVMGNNAVFVAHWPERVPVCVIPKVGVSTVMRCAHQNPI